MPINLSPIFPPTFLISHSWFPKSNAKRISPAYGWGITGDVIPHAGNSCIGGLKIIIHAATIKVATGRESSRLPEEFVCQAAPVLSVGILWWSLVPEICQGSAWKERGYLLGSIHNIPKDWLVRLAHPRCTEPWSNHHWALRRLHNERPLALE